jgi:ABC-type sugar transport system substrate-binding protein
MTSDTRSALSRLTKAALLVAGGAALGLTLAGGAFADDLIDPSIAKGSLAGKRVLLSPYWLDTFGTANASWLTRILEPYGIKVDAENPNGTASKQADEIQSAIASHNYDVIVWQPVDSQTVVATVKKIQDEKIPQVLQFGDPDQGGLHYSVANIDWKKNFEEPGRDAANFVKAHPALGPVKVAWMGPYPNVRICEDRFAGFLDGVKSVAPDAEVVFQGAATSQEQARSKMTDFLTRDIAFNVFIGCGGNESLGGIAAINAAGLGAAVDKVPQHVFMASVNASPPELEMLWNKDSSLMRSGLFGPKTAAEVDAKLVLNLLTGKTAYNATAIGALSMTWLTPDCDAGRAAAVDQFKGVEGFTVPECSFKYKAN